MKLEGRKAIVTGGAQGIGLAIAKAIVEKQGGKVTVKQDENLKIHFCVTF